MCQNCVQQSQENFIIMKQKLIYRIWNYMKLDYWHSRSSCIQRCLKAESLYHQTILLCICIAYIMCLQYHTVSCFVIFIWETDSGWKQYCSKEEKKGEHFLAQPHVSEAAENLFKAALILWPAKLLALFMAQQVGEGTIQKGMRSAVGQLLCAAPSFRAIAQGGCADHVHIPALHPRC